MWQKFLSKSHKSMPCKAERPLWPNPSNLPFKPMTLQLKTMQTLRFTTAVFPKSKAHDVPQNYPTVFRTANAPRTCRPHGGAIDLCNPSDTHRMAYYLRTSFCRQTWTVLLHQEKLLPALHLPPPTWPRVNQCAVERVGTLVDPQHPYAHTSPTMS